MFSLIVYHYTINDDYMQYSIFSTWFLANCIYCFLVIIIVGVNYMEWGMNCEHA